MKDKWREREGEREAKGEKRKGCSKANEDKGKKKLEKDERNVETHGSGKRKTANEKRIFFFFYI